MFVNVGPRTAAKTFTFRNNAWHQVDGNRKPVLPAPEQNGIYKVRVSVDLQSRKQGMLKILDSRLGDIGAHSTFLSEIPIEIKKNVGQLE